MENALTRSNVSWSGTTTHRSEAPLKCPSRPLRLTSEIPVSAAGMPITGGGVGGVLEEGAGGAGGGVLVRPSKVQAATGDGTPACPSRSFPTCWDVSFTFQIPTRWIRPWKGYSLFATIPPLAHPM
eukprot:2442411-Rhodomonas_salina.1